MLLKEFVEFYVSGRDVSEGYSEQLMCLVRAMNKIKPGILISDLTVELVNRHLKSTRDVLSPETRKSRRRMFLTIWQAATDAGILPECPRRHIMRITVPDKLQRAWTLEEVRRLLIVCNGLLGRFPNDIRRSGYWSSYVMAAWDSGLRGCDLRQLRRPTIQDDVSCMLIQSKTGRRLRCRFRPATIAAIDATFPPDREIVWPLWGRLETWRRAARAIVTKAGVGGHIGQLRHSSGTAVEIEQPGHGHEHLGNSRSVFERHYLDHEKISVRAPMPPALVS